MSGEQTVLAIRDLSVDYQSRRGAVRALRQVSLDVRAGESLALIGESGSGKSTMAFTLIRLLPKAGRVKGGKVIFQREGAPVDVLALSPQEVRHFRWQDCAMVLQSALNAFNPVLRIRDQFLDTARAHGLSDRAEVMQRAGELLKLVQLDARRVLNAFPHELSGGMRQRVLLAMGLLLQPRILILDEPTTALDILTQRTIIEVLRRLKEAVGFAMLFISHDLSLAAELADRVATMYAGRVVEVGSVFDVYKRPLHPYTLGLIRAVPTLTGDRKELQSIPGSPPDLVNLPVGCSFHPRCPYATEDCRREDPPLVEAVPGRQVACWHWEKVFAEAEVSA